MTPPPVLFDVVGGVATITLNRPEAANGLDVPTVEALHAAATRCEGDPGVRAVLLAGNGRYFCAGGDVKEFTRQVTDGDLTAFSRHVAALLHQAISRLHRLDAPLVAAVHGAAAGAGLSMVCAADLAVLGSGARLRAGYPGIGATLDGGLSYFLPRLVGIRRALDLALTNRDIDAEQALAWGLVSEVVPDDQVRERATALAATLAGGPTRALGDIKRLMFANWTAGLETALEDEARSIHAAFGRPDALEGIDAFVAKRKPAFRGE